MVHEREGIECRRGRFLCSCTVAAFAMLVSVLAAAEERPAEKPLQTPDGMLARLEPHDLSGHVVDSDGKPVKKAQVFLYYSWGDGAARDRLVGQTKTNRKGKFTFKGGVVWERVKPREDEGTPEYAVIARHQKFGISFAKVREGDSLDDVTVTMDRERTYNVNVTDAEGKPVEGARVFLDSGRLPESLAKTVDRRYRYLGLQRDIGVSSGVTDAAGHAELIGPYDAGFKVLKDGYAEGHFRNAKVILFPSAQVSGKVTYPAGAPAAGALVRFEYDGVSLVWSATTLTDAEGNYVFANVPGSGYRYSWMKPEEETGGASNGRISADDLRPGSPYVSKSVTFPINPGDKAVQDVSFARGVVFAGTATDVSADAPALNMCLNVYVQTGGRYLDVIRLKADENGRFRTVLAPGSEIQVEWQRSREDGDYLIDQDWLNQNNRQAFRGTVTEDKTDLDLRVKLWRVQPLRGRVVTAQGDPVKGASVYLHSDVPAAKTDEAGMFTLKTAPMDRDFDLFAVDADKNAAGILSLKAGATEATITLEPALEYRGHVLNTEGFPAQDLKFYLDLRLNEASLYAVREEPQTDKEGQFTVAHLCPKATYYAWWSSDNDENRDYDYGNATIDLAQQAPGAPIQFEAKQYLNALMGRAVNRRGEPVAGAKVRVTTNELVHQNEWDKEFSANNKGEFEVPRLAPGEAGLRVSAEGYKAVQVRAPSDSIDLLATLVPASEPARWNVHVIDQDGRPVANAPVSFKLTVHTEKGPSHQTRTLETDKNGEARFTYKPKEEQKNGRGMVGCDFKGYDVAYRGVALDEDAELTLVVRKGAAHWTGRVVDQDGRPIEGAGVNVVGMRQGKGDFRSLALLGDDSAFSYVTDAEGRFELARFSKADGVSLKVGGSQYSREDGWLDPERDKDLEKTFQLNLAARVTGKIVLREAGTPVAGMYVQIEERSGSEYSCEVSGDGTFAADGLRPGKYQVRCGGKDEATRKYVCPSPPAFTVAAGQSLEILVEVEEGIPLRGRLIEKLTGTRPKGRANVTALLQGRPVSWTDVKEDGTWEMYLYEGTFDMQYYIEGAQSPAPPRPVTVEKGKTGEEILIEAELTNPSG